MKKSALAAISTGILLAGGIHINIAPDTCYGALGDYTIRRNNNSNDISIEQAISDEAQMKTIAFDGLAFLTGDLCSDTFFPPGKVSDFFGFQYMRDIAPNGFGHNTEFAGRVSDSVLSILTDAQVQAMVTLANTQVDQIYAYGYKRFVLMKAFRRLLENDLPDGADGLDKSVVMELSADLYEIDGEISYARANVIGGIVAELTDTQRTALVELEAEFNALFEAAGEGGVIADEDWPASTPVDLSDLEVEDGRVLVSTYGGQLFSWYLGSVEGDTYFCPERHGTYFGSFYMKDIPPISATEGVTIDEGVTAEMGTAFLNVMDDTQEALVIGLVDIQRTALYSIVSKREEISQQLRLFMDSVSVEKNEILTLVRQYGEYDGEIVYNYATNFAAVGDTLTADQAETLMGLRVDYYERFPAYQENPNVYDCTGAWLYSSRIDMPEIMNTDFLFTASADDYVLDSGDYNGDGTDDIAVFRESAGLWAIRGVSRAYFGTAGDVPVSGDYNGDGTTDIGIFRDTSGLWAVKGVTRVYFGTAADTAVPLAYNPSGACAIGIFRGSTGLWAIRGETRVYFGRSGDRPVPGDYNGNGTKEIGVFRESSGLWALRGISRIYFGTGGDEAVPGDYDGNGSWETGIFRASSGLWAIRSVSRTYFGGSSDEPVPADYDGDGTDDIGLFRDLSGLWAIKGVTLIYYGGAGDVPVTR